MSVRSLAKALDYSDAGGTKSRREVVGLQGKKFLLLLCFLALAAFEFVSLFCHGFLYRSQES